jgi:hypothetical protein
MVSISNYYTPAPRRGRGLYCLDDFGMFLRCRGKESLSTCLFFIFRFPCDSQWFLYIYLWVLIIFYFISLKYAKIQKYNFFPEGGGGYTVLPLSVCPSFRPSNIFFVAFFSANIDDRNLIFGHRFHIGMPYCGKRFWSKNASHNMAYLYETCDQISDSCHQ